MIRLPPWSKRTNTLFPSTALVRSGERLRGRFVVVRRDDKPAGGKEQWLLLHKNDDDAVPGWDAEEHPTSVKSGRTNDEVKADPSAMWHSNRGRDAELPAPEPLPTWDAAKIGRATCRERGGQYV